MKNLRITTIFTLLLLSSLAVNAGNGDGNLSSFSKKVKSVLKTPEAIKETKTPQKITIFFSVNENGDVTDVFAKTDNKEAKQDLESQFKCMNFKGLKPSVINSIDVNFIVY